MSKKEEWEVEFENIENKSYPAGQPKNYLKSEQVKDIKDFIRAQRSLAKKEAIIEVHKSLVDFVWKHRTADDGEVVFARFTKSALENFERLLSTIEEKEI